MDRFVVRQNENAVNARSTDLLTLMKAAKSKSEANVQINTSNNKRSRDENATTTGKKQKVEREEIKNDVKKVDSVAAEWESYTGTTVNILDVTCHAMREKIKQKNFVGWKTGSDGKKVYTTFRNGERVQGDGKEAFRLALGDGKIKSKTK